MARYYTDPTTGARVQIKKTHRFRNFVVLPAVGVVGLIAVISAATGGGGEAPSVPQLAPGAGVPAAGQEATAPRASTLEVFGTGEATLTMLKGGASASNTVQLPHTEELPEGYISASVTRSPSLESYMNNGNGDTGEVGCRIIRGGEVVEEQKASGKFASVTCTKFL